MNIKNNISGLIQNLPAGCRLIAVSKTQPTDSIREAYNAGQRVFGENKAQELREKYDALPKDIEWHMIGHLQSNKVKYIAPFVALIHSVDSIKLAEEINRQAIRFNRTIPCLLQVHIADEETKFGFSVEEVLEVITQNKLEPFQNIQITGLMGMATFSDDQNKVRSEFKKLKSLFDRLATLNLPPRTEMKELSMGMSGDYKIAAEEGSTLVRIGTAIFGNRNYQV